MFGLYVVSIDKLNGQRLSSFFDQIVFKNISKDIIDVVGIKGGNLTAKEYFNLAVHGRDKPLTPSEVGCTLSHLEIYEKFLLSDKKMAFIFEDDAIFPKELSFFNLFEQIKKTQLKENFLLSLGGVQMKVCRNVRGEIQNSAFISNRLIKINPNFFHRVCYTFSYVIDRKMAVTLLEYHSKLRRADDWSFLYDFNPTVNIYMTDLIDHPIDQNIKNSYIEMERFKILDIPTSSYGKGISKQLAKIKYKKFR